MGIPIVDTNGLKELQCGTCGVWHAIPTAMYNACYSEGGYWHCPNGHSRGYDKGSLYNENERLKKELDAAKKRKEWAEQEVRNAAAREAASQAKVKKLKKRIANGVCPCCTRSFTNLHRHIKTKHPDYAAKV